MWEGSKSVLQCVGRQNICVTECGKVACLCYRMWEGSKPVSLCVEGNMSVSQNVGN